MGIDPAGEAPLHEEALMTAALRLDVPELTDLIERRDLTVDDVAHLPEDLRYELVDGRLVLSPTPLASHQWIGYDVVHACGVNAPVDVAPIGEMSVMIDSRNERRPDIVMVHVECGNVSPIDVVHVILIGEIVSPSSRVIDGKDKLKVYADAGVPYYWIIDPLAERVTLTEFVLGSGGVYHEGVRTDERVTLTRPWEIMLDLPALTERRDRLGRPRRTT